MAVGAAAMAPAVWLARRAIEGRVGTTGLGAQILTGLGPIAAGVMVYAVASAAFRLPEAAEIAALLRRPPAERTRLDP
jgi:hypothetical protein